MALDVSGSLLEGIRIATSNNPLTYPPDNFISDDTAFEANESRSEYLIYISGNLNDYDIGSPDLKFLWSRNNNTIQRFSWDGFNRRWGLNPGTIPKKLGKISNEPRITVPVPDLDVSPTESRYDLYIGLINRIITFSYSVVSSNDEFTILSSGQVQISRETGNLNFSEDDLNNQILVSNDLYLSAQTFYDRSRVDGKIGSFPISSGVSYDLYLNPIPSSHQIPQIRMGNKLHLKSIQVNDDQALYTPNSGEVVFSISSGKVVFSSNDVGSNLGVDVFYDGCCLGELSLNSILMGATIAYPTPVGANVDLINGSSDDYYCFINSNSGRYYLTLVFVDSISQPPEGFAYIDKNSGNLYVNPNDAANFPFLDIKLVSRNLLVDKGTSVKFTRSSVNGMGYPKVSDFYKVYSVEDQVISGSLSGSPFLILPTVPIDNEFLNYKCTTPSGSGGFFSGNLKNSKDPLQIGYGFYVDYKLKQFKFTNRTLEVVKVEKSSSAFKLTNSALITEGSSVTVNDVEYQPGTNFVFNRNSGLVEFYGSTGENDSNNKYFLSGTVNNDILTSDTDAFFTNSGFICIDDGLNAGFYEILAVIDFKHVRVDRDFALNTSVNFSFKAKGEILVNNVWKQFNNEYKKVEVYLSDSFSGTFQKLPSKDYVVVQSTGLVNFSSKLKTGQVVKVKYSVLSDGAASDPKESVVGFRITQEVGSYTTNTRIISFNPSNKNVVSSYPFIVYIDGVSLSENEFTLNLPNKITISKNLTSEFVTINYYVAEAKGGENSVSLPESPIDLDFPAINSGENVFSVNGDQTGKLKPKAFLLIDGSSVFLIANSIYNSSLDSTSITVSTPFNFNSNYVTNIKYSSPVMNFDQELLGVSSINQKTNFFVLDGVTIYYPNQILNVDNDYYMVVSSAVTDGKTTVSVSTNFQKNYVNPKITKSRYPIFSLTNSFQTKNDLTTNFPTFIYRNGKNPGLISSSDYSVSDGGSIKLSSTISEDDSLIIFYAHRSNIQKGSIIKANYSYLIAPDSSNGILGQSLLSTYQLYNPDSFYYRIETITSFIPEVIEQFNSSSSSSSSGPNIQSTTSLQNKDYGSKSIKFDEQYYGNFDTVISRLLGFYNSQVNYYEDILANFDGRCVGGNSGKFRYDNDTSGNKRNTYSEIKNDIDDLISLYIEQQLTNLNPFTYDDVNVYGSMSDYNGVSRLFNNSIQGRTVIFNDKTSVGLDYGKTIGNYGISNLSSTGPFRTTPSRSKFTLNDESGFILKAQFAKGDSSNLLPLFYIGQVITIFDKKGIELFNTTISNISDPDLIAIANPVNVDGFIRADVSDTGSPGVRAYNEGYSIDNPTGRIRNVLLPAPFGPSGGIQGNELVDSDISFNPSNTTPNRIPVLDGLLLNDSGKYPDPVTTYDNEIELYNEELEAIELIVTLSIQSINTVIGYAGPTLTLSPASFITIVDGPNQGAILTVVSIMSSTSFTFTSSFPVSVDLTLRRALVNFDVYSPVRDIRDIIEDEINVLNDNIEVDAVTPELIGSLDSQQISSVNSAISLGTVLDFGIGNCTAFDTIVDVSKNFVDQNVQITTSDYLVVEEGVNIGLYSIIEVNLNSIKVNGSFPFHLFRSITSGIKYHIIKKWEFLSMAQVSFLSDFINSNYDWIQQTNSWLNTFDVSGITGRRGNLEQRITYINDSISKINNILTSSDQMYEMRYLWIQQRTDKISGYKVKKSQAIQQQSSTRSQIQQDQLKIFVASKIK